MVKRALTLLTSILFALPLLMPFNIYGAELPQTEIIGVDYNLISYSSNTNNSGAMFYSYTYEIEVKLNNNYVGVVDGTLSYSWTNQDTSTGNPTSHTATNKRKSYVNGNSFKVNIVLQGTYSTFTGKGPLISVSYLVDNSDTNVIKYEDLDSIETVVNLLQDIYQNSSDIENLSTNQLTELENIVTNTNLSNQYLETLTKMRQWNIPIESYGFVIGVLNAGLDLLEFDNSYLNYPMFKGAKGQKYLSTYISSGYVYNMIFIIDQNLYNTEYVNIGLGLSDYFDTQDVYRDRLNLTNGSLVYLINVQLTAKTSGQINLNFGYRMGIFIPIYFQRNTFKVSTDFALRYGLSNTLLDDIHLIANGTTASQSAADSSQSANEQLQTDSNTLFQQEDSFKSDMNNAMQNVNTTFRLQDMGTKFVNSAQWVRTQFEQLTNNTPFASLITFSLITGLALILLGKVYR